MKLKKPWLMKKMLKVLKEPLKKLLLLHRKLKRLKKFKMLKKILLKMKMPKLSMI
jgi:hypothetical protein